MRARSRGLGRAGVGLVLLYVVVALGTDRLSSRPVLPLFDGFAPPTAYAWVNPPPERAGDNVAPQAAAREFPLDAEGSQATNAATDDAQAIVGLNKGSVPPNPPDTAVTVKITPVDAATLGPLPPGQRALSNAYEVRLNYLPSQTPVTRLAADGTLALTASDNGDRLLYSADGQTWEERPFRPFGTDHGLFTEFQAPGWFVIATTRGAAVDGDRGSGAPRGVLLTVAAIVPIVGALLVVRLPSPVPAGGSGSSRRSTGSVKRPAASVKRPSGRKKGGKRRR